MSSQAERTKAEADFQALLGQLSHLEPRFGFERIEQMPELTDAETRVVLAAEPDLVADALSEPTYLPLFIERVGRPVLKDRIEDLGAITLVCLRAAARRYAFSELRAFCERERADGVETHGCVTEREAGVSA